MDKTLEFVLEDAKRIYAKCDRAHDFHHIERVLYNSDLISADIKCEKHLLYLICILHDIDDKKTPLYQGDGVNATKILRKHNFPDEQIDQIIDEINLISYSNGKTPKTIEGKIVQDADRIDACGAIGISRTFTYGGANNIPIYSKEEYCTIQHFYDKLLSLDDHMNFSISKNIIKSRIDFLKLFLKEFYYELGINT